MKPPPPIANTDFLTICGLAAVQMICRKRLTSVERLFFDTDRAPLFAKACQRLAQDRKIYRMVKSEELKKIAHTEHHGGTACVIRTIEPMFRLDGVERAFYLHDVSNPHNIGAIARSLAFFGVTDLILSPISYRAAMTASAFRVAEGGLTILRLYEAQKPSDLFSYCQLHQITTVATVKPQATYRNSSQTIPSGKVCICLGNEENGLSDEFARQCDVAFSLSGSNEIESINVSAVAAILASALSKEVVC